MRAYSFALSLVVLTACSSEDSTEGAYYGAPAGADPGGEHDASATWLGGCGDSLRQQRAGLCERTERAATAADESALGFAADALLQLIRGEHRATVSWYADDEPSGRSSELVLTVQPQGPVRYVEQALGASGRSETFTFGNTGGRYYTCGDLLAVDAELSVMMPDGTLEETLQATIEAESGTYARVLLDVPSSSVVGSLRTAIEQRGSDRLSLALGITPLGTGLEGSLSASRSQVGTSPDLASSCATLGSASVAQGCPLGAYPLSGSDEVLGLSISRAIERLNATSPAVLEDSGAELSLAFAAASARSCVSIDTPATLPLVLEFPGSVSLGSSDGRVEGSLDVQLSAEATGGTLQLVRAHTEYLAPEPSGLPALAPRYAIQEPLSWSALEMGGFHFEVEAREQESGGVLRALGGNLSCQSSRPCEEVCPGPGCTVSPAEKWAVRWGEMRLGTDPSLR